MDRSLHISFDESIVPLQDVTGPSFSTTTCSHILSPISKLDLASRLKIAKESNDQVISRQLGYIFDLNIFAFYGRRRIVLNSLEHHAVE